MSIRQIIMLNSYFSVSINFKQLWYRYYIISYLKNGMTYMYTEYY